MDYNPKVFTKLSYGVYIVTTWDRGKPTGCVANSAMQITSEPATIAVSIHHNNFTNTCIKQCNHFAVNIMAENQAPDLIGKMGYSSAKRVKKFDGVPYTLKSRMPIIDSSLGFISCKVINTVETDTHTIFIGEVIGGEIMDEQGKPMTYAYYHDVVKAKAAPNAPTFIKED